MQTASGPSSSRLAFGSLRTMMDRVMWLMFFVAIICMVALAMMEPLS